MGTNCAPLVADLFLFCYERDFMMSLSDDKQADVIDAFNTTSRYLDDILSINNVYFDNMVSQIYPSELQLNKANTSDTEAAFLDLQFSISNDIVFTKKYDKRNDFDFQIVNFPFLDGDVPRSTSYGVYISQLIRFARASSYVADFNTHNKLLTQKLLKQGYWYHKLRKTVSKFYRRYFDLISKFQVGLKSLLRQGLSEPNFYGDLVYKLKKIVGSDCFSAQFIKVISHYKKIGYNINVLQQTACLVVNPITVDNSSLQCYSVLSDILVKNELCIPLERGSNVLSTGEGFICLSPPSKLKIAVLFCSIYKKTISFSAIMI